MSKVAIVGTSPLAEVVASSYRSSVTPVESIPSDAKVVVLIVEDGDGREAVARLRDVAPRAMLLCAGAGGDALVAACDWPGGDRLLGVGTIALTLAFRLGIAKRLRVHVDAVHAQIVGSVERPVPLWSTATVAGVPLHQWSVPGHGNPTVRDRTAILMEARQTIAAATVEDRAAPIVGTLNALLDRASRALTPTTRVPAGTYGLESDATLALPRLIGDGRLGPVLSVATNPAELAGIAYAAEAMRSIDA